jgi:hypothetical protein
LQWLPRSLRRRTARAGPTSIPIRSRTDGRAAARGRSERQRHWVGVADDNTRQERWFTTFDAGATWSTGLLPSPGSAFQGAVINVDGSVLAVATDLDIDLGVRSYRSNDGGLTQS